MESQIDPHETCPAQNIIKLINKLVVDEALIAAPKLINWAYFHRHHSVSEINEQLTFMVKSSVVADSPCN